MSTFSCMCNCAYDFNIIFLNSRQLTPLKTAVLATNVYHFALYSVFVDIKGKLEFVMSWDRVELWWALILKVISHFILKKAHFMGHNRHSQELYFLKIYWRFWQKPNVFSQQNKVFTLQNYLSQPLWSIKHFWLINPPNVWISESDTSNWSA